MNDMRNFGCSGGSCPKQNNCARFLERQDRAHKFHSPPFNMYNRGDKTEFCCGYQEYPSKERE